jgi:hypothetical protein
MYSLAVSPSVVTSAVSIAFGNETLVKYGDTSRSDPSFNLRTALEPCE